MNEKPFKKQIELELAKCKIIDNIDGTVDITGNLTVYFPLNYLPKIRTINGDFNCSKNQYLTALNGSPINVNGSFYCNNCNSLNTLQGAPNQVLNDFHCNHCPVLKTLEGAPQIIGRDFYCSDCQSLKTLKGSPTIIPRFFSCANCNNLESLLGGPHKVGKMFDLIECKKLPNDAYNKMKEAQKEDIKRDLLETSSNNQNEPTWKHLK